MSDETTNEKDTTQTIAVCLLTEYENRLIRHIVYARRYLIKDFFYDAIDFFMEFKKHHKDDPRKFKDHGLYQTYGKKEHHVKLSVALGAEYRLKIDTLAEEDDRDLRTVLRTAVIEYLNSLKYSGALDVYENELKNIHFVEKVEQK
jgi:hypothetical protein